jgi:hypothetical protein
MEAPSLFAYQGKFPWKLAIDHIQASIRQEIGAENTMTLMAGPWTNPRPDLFSATRLKRLLQAIYAPAYDESEDCGNRVGQPRIGHQPILPSALEIE